MLLRLAALCWRGCHVILILTVTTNWTCVHMWNPALCCLWSKTEHSNMRLLQQVLTLIIIFSQRLLSHVKLLISLLRFVRVLVLTPFEYAQGHPSGDLKAAQDLLLLPAGSSLASCKELGPAKPAFWILPKTTECRTSTGRLLLSETCYRFFQS